MDKSPEHLIVPCEGEPRWPSEIAGIANDVNYQIELFERVLDCMVENDVPLNTLDAIEIKETLRHIRLMSALAFKNGAGYNPSTGKLQAP